MEREKLGEKVRRLIPLKSTEIRAGVFSGAIVWALLCHQNVEEDRQEVKNDAIAAKEHYDKAIRISRKCGMAAFEGSAKVEAALSHRLSYELEDLDYEVARILKIDRQQSFFDDLVSLGDPAGLEQLSEEFRSTVMAAGNHELGIWIDRPRCSVIFP